MPFTPFHWGPNSVLGVALTKIFDLPTLLVACVIVDLEPLSVMAFGWHYPLHGFFHSFMGATLAGLGTAALMVPLQPYLRIFTTPLRLAQDSSWLKILWTSLFGVFSHVLLDAPLYRDIQPFYPLAKNPFYRLFEFETIYLFCAVCFGIALIAYVMKITLTREKSEEKTSGI